MKVRSTIPLYLAAAFSIAPLSQSWAMSPAQLTGTNFQVPDVNASNSQSAPNISGTGVVWTELSGNNFDAYYYDLSANGPRPRALTSTTIEDELGIDIDGNNAVWGAFASNGTSENHITWMNLTTGSQTIVASGGNAWQYSNPAVRGRYIPFVTRTTQYDIDVWDISIGAPPGPRVTNDAAMQRSPRVSGDLIVYEDFNSDPNSAVTYGYHVSTTGPSFRIGSGPSRSPDIDGNNVVWISSTGYNSSTGNYINDQVQLKNLATGVTTTLTASTGNMDRVRISGNWVVYGDDRTGTSQVYAYNIATSTEYIVTSGSTYRGGPAISGNRIAYQALSADGSVYKVFVFTIQ